MRNDRAASADAYAESVVTALTPHFSDLEDAVTADVVRDAVRKHALNHGDHVEVIIDSAYVANWRLKAASNQPGRVRVACYRHPANDTDMERERMLNELLATVV
ncbi:hypothetical protein ACQEVF_56920 [Nonomuraea polychroma]|uniref:hypothetical protein n=1 Tax=Nonomuraea polychroma TaxID=46176 RepID=UPI003D8A907F